jgi:predicted outer membrane repeat protein
MARYLLFLSLHLVCRGDGSEIATWKELRTQVQAATTTTNPTLFLGPTFSSSDYNGVILISATDVNITIDASRTTGVVLDALNQDRLFVIDKQSTLTLIGPMTIQGGHSSDDESGGEQGGGAIQVKKGELITKDVDFQNSFSGDGYGGGAIAVNEGSLLMMTGGAVKHNGNAPDGHGTSGTGGGILVTGTMTGTGITFEGNTAKDNGGAISTNRGTVTLSRCTIEANHAPAGSAIVAMFTSTVALKDMIITGNDNPMTELQFQTGAKLELNDPPPCSRVSLISKMFSLQCQKSSSSTSSLTTCCAAMHAAEDMVLHSLYTHYTLTIHSLSTHYPLTIHSLYTHYPLTIHSLYTHYTLTIHSLSTHYPLAIHSLYTHYTHHLTIRIISLYSDLWEEGTKKKKFW